MKRFKALALAGCVISLVIEKESLSLLAAVLVILAFGERHEVPVHAARSVLSATDPSFIALLTYRPSVLRAHRQQRR